MSSLIFDIAQFVKNSLEYKLLMSALTHSCQKEPTEFFLKIVFIMSCKHQHYNIKEL
jgi:hypothetical protein